MFSLKPSVNDKEQNFLLGKPGEVFRYNTDFKYIKYGLSSSSVQPFFFFSVQPLFWPILYMLNLINMQTRGMHLYKITA